MRQGIPQPVQEALSRDLAEARASGDAEGLVRVLVEIGATADSAMRCAAVASELLHLERFEEALAAAVRATGLATENADVWNIRGIALHALGRNAEAVEAYDRALALVAANAPQTAESFTAGLSELDGTIADALSELSRLYTLANVLNNRGNSLHDIKKFEEVLASYRRAT